MNKLVVVLMFEQLVVVLMFENGSEVEFVVDGNLDVGDSDVGNLDVEFVVDGNYCLPVLLWSFSVLALLKMCF